PDTPSFTDVPTTDFGYQYIEALKASGITGGCGNGTTFCPDANLTRRQMAVFLAKALRLHWPHWSSSVPRWAGLRAGASFKRAERDAGRTTRTAPRAAR